MSDEPEEFHPYVRLLLARMKSNPDDFNYEADAVPVTGEMYFTEAEEAALWKARREISLGRMHSKLMEQILQPNEPKENKYSTREWYNPPQLDRDAYLAQSQPVYCGARLSMSTVAIGGTGTVTAELIKSLNKLVGR